MRCFIIVLISLCLIFESGCCQSEPLQPSYPSEELGWREFRIGSVYYIGRLVLKKGEASDNGKIGVVVVDIIPPDLCADYNSPLGRARAMLRIFRVSDNQIICEPTVIGGGTVNLEADSYCGPNDSFTGISVNAINTKDMWVSFTLSNRHLLRKEK